MKTIFNVTNDVFDRGLNECEKYFDEYYKKYGFILNIELQECYKIYDNIHVLNEGDRVYICDFFWTISWKSYDLNQNIMIYNLNKE